MVDDKFNFQKSSYITVGSINRNCIKLLPPEKPGKPQAVAIGDTRGIVYVTDHKKDEPEVKAKTNPYPKEITALDIAMFGGKEKLFFSFSNTTYMTNANCKVSDKYNEYNIKIILIN